MSATTTPDPGLGRSYWRLWVSSAASNLADGVFFIALPLIAVRLTDSPVLVAGVAVAGRLPWLLFVLVAGALADRLDRRRTMINVQLARVLIVGAMAVLALFDLLSLPALYAVALVLGIGETLFDTSAQSLMPSIVAKEQLSKANGRLYAVELSMNQFVGPPAGGFLVAISIPLALGGAAVGYAVAALGLVLIAGSFKPERKGPKTSIATDIAEGLRYLIRHRLLRTLAVMVGVMNLASSAVFAIFVLYAVAPGPMRLSEPEFGVLLTSFALGSLAGSFVVERIERRMGPANILLLAVIAGAVTTALPAFTTNPFIVGASFALAGITVVMWNVITVSLRQRIVPSGMLGRLNASYRLFAWGTQPLGALMGGVIGEVVGLPAVFIVGGLLTLTLVLARGIVTDEAIADAERTTELEARPAPA
jgi:MFS family permease